MNRKLLVLAMVPVLVVMSGALAFSAFTGSATTQVNASAGYLAWSQTETSQYVYHDNTQVTSTFSPGNTVSTPTSGPNMTTLTITVNDLAPGNWAVFNFTITNTGTVGFILDEKVTTMGPAAPLTNQSVSSDELSTTFTYGQPLGETGYYYYVSPIPSTSIDPQGTVHFQIYVGLGSQSDNSYQESAFSITVSLSVTSDP